VTPSAHIRRLMPRGIRPHRILAGPLRGRTIVTSWHDYPSAILGRTERALLQWFERNVQSGESWLDAGAHYGYTAMALSELVGRSGRVFAFEPVLATAGHLARTRALNDLPQLIVLPFGLGAADRLALKRLPIERGMADSTLEADARRLETVLTVRLDSIWRDLCEGEPRIDGVKIDVQGMEIETLQGMAAVLREFTPRLVLEVHRGVDRRELLDLLESLGYARDGDPVDPRGVDGDGGGPYRDDHSYVFTARSGAAS